MTSVVLYLETAALTEEEELRRYVCSMCALSIALHATFAALT